MHKIIISLFLSGLFFGAGPCLASCGPVLISYIAGTKKGVFRSLEAYCLFSLARIFVYALLAIAVFFSGEFLFRRLSQQYSRYITIGTGIFMALLGLAIALGRQKENAFCRFLGNNILGKGRFSVAIMGLLFGLLPCAPLVAIFSYIGLAAKSWAVSLLYALSFGLGTFVSPLALLAGLAGLAPKFLDGKKESYLRLFNFICGAVIIALGIQLIGRVF